jgi:fibro-slime domain-containing protein
VRAAWIGVALTLAACGPSPDDVATGPDASGAPDARDVPPGDGGDVGCNALPVRIRDFRITHPDFQRFTSNAVTPGLVEATLGQDGTPTYAHPGGTVCTTGPDEFADWYHDVAGVNQPIDQTLELLETAPGTYVFDSAAFFPIDGQGFGAEGLAHNYSFTTEIHTTFHYQGGETFTFRGDDDLWLFINNQLAIDLGGLHEPATASVDLDAQAAVLGITPGGAYAMDIFQAERHTDASNFRIETTIACFVVP